MLLCFIFIYLFGTYVCLSNIFIEYLYNFYYGSHKSCSSLGSSSWARRYMAVVLPIRRKILSNQTISIWDGGMGTAQLQFCLYLLKKRQFMAQIFLRLVLDIIFQYIYHVSSKSIHF